jgi:hypothetical protein
LGLSRRKAVTGDGCQSAVTFEFSGAKVITGWSSSGTILIRMSNLCLARQKSIATHFFLVICAVTFAGFLSGCDGFTQIKGIVLDSDDAPIADADVALMVGERKQEIKSSNHGVFRVGMTHSPRNPQLMLRVEKPGFKPFEKRFHAKEHLETIVVTLEPVEHSPDSVVRELYQQIVARRPLGIPKGADKAAIWPFLSNRLTQELDAAQACEGDYYRQMTDKNSKPGFAWLENGLFSGANEEALPSATALERTEALKDGSFHVYVRLTFKESFETYGRPPNPADTFQWRVVAVVMSQDGRFVVDDVLFFKDGSTEFESRLADSFPGCGGSRWTGDKMKTDSLGEQ